MANEWTPWMKHDGNGLAVPPYSYVRRKFDQPVILARDPERGPVTMDESYVSETEAMNWHKASGWPLVTEYQVYRPKTLRGLIDMIEHLPAQADA